MLPLVSVIIPVYRRFGELKKTFDSLLSQTYTELEYILVDDGNQPALDFSELQSKSTRPFLGFRQEHKGAPAARNFGFARSKGSYVLFCDADLRAEPDMIQTMLEALEQNPDAAYAYSNFYWGLKRFKSQAFDYERLEQINYITTVSLIRRECFFGFDETLKRFQDWDLWLSMAKRGMSGHWIDRYLFAYKTNGTMSSWLPSFVYQKPWRFIPGIRQKVEAYEMAKKTIQKKHTLPI